MYDSGNIFFITVFTAGILSFFAPCIFPVLPVYMTMLVDDTGNKCITIGKFKIYIRPIVKTLCFVFGLSVIFMTLGFGAGVIGNIFSSRYTSIVMGIIVIFLGLHQIGILNFKLLQRSKQVEIKAENKNYIGAFILGLAFSFGWTPCVGPVLSSVIAISTTGNGLYGLLLMGIYSLGLSIPFLLIAILSNYVMKYFAKIRKYIPLLKKIGGTIIVLMGVLLIVGQLGYISSWFSSL